ncbi:MAG: DNA repair protein RecN [Bacteroidota bacterium]
MLRKLQIQYYAIIDSIEIEFAPHLNIITGETGAGKSILMGALSLILGERADSSVLRYADKKSVIEGYFQIENKQNVLDFLAKNDLDIENELVIRREIAPNGKSRAFINDTPASLQQLKELASLLVDLHQQFDTLTLGDNDFQRTVLDALASNQSTLQNYQSVFQQWQTVKKELADLENRKIIFQKEFDYHQFLFEELKEQSFKENELEEIEVELQLLSHAEGIKAVLSKVNHDLESGDQPILPLFKQWINQLNSIAAFHAGIPELIKRIESSHIELQDITDEMEQLNSKVQLDEKRMEWINDRMAAGYKLLKKHNVKTTVELLAIQKDLAEKLDAVLLIDETIAEKQKLVAVSFGEATSMAKKLSEARKKEAAPLENKVNELLILVGMPNARLKLSIEDSPLHIYGSDQIEFLFDANKSNRFETIRKVASGGELSRLMLCIKSLVAEKVDLATLIFDEIDTGISGEAAKQVGRIMKGLSKNRQIICITHQPQIAGKADAHFYVYKEEQSGSIKTNLRLLSNEERINKIAQMLGGETPSAAALENAKEMMQV